MADKEMTAAEKALAEQAKRDARSAELKAKRDLERDARAGETKADAFKRIAVNRTNNTLSALATLENTFDKANYDYTDDQANMVIGAIEKAVSSLKARASGASKAKAGFTL